MRSLTTATNATNRAFERANVSAQAFRAHLASITQSGGAIGLAAAAANRGGGGAARLPPPGGGGGSSGGGGRGYGPGGGFHGGNVHFGANGVGLGTAGFAAGDAFWPLLAAGASIYAGKSLFESAKALNTEQNRFRLFGMTEGQNQEAFTFARNMGVYGTTQVDRLAAMREAQGVFRESGLSGSAALEGAKLASPVLAKLDFLASSLDEESRARMHASNISMLRYVESSGGLKSPEEFNRIADFGYKLNVSSGGTVNWEQLRQLKARAGASGFHLTDDAMARLEPVIAEMKGGAVGFGLSTAFNRLTGATRVPNQIAHELVDQGIWNNKAIAWNKNGGIKQFTTPGGPLSKDKIELLSTNPELFYEQYIKPMYSRMKLDAAEIARQNVMIFGSTGGRNMTLIDNQMDNIHRSVDALNKTLGIGAAGNAARNSLSGQEQEFGAAWTDFKTNFGTTALPFFTGVLKAGSNILRQLPDGSSPIGNAANAAKAFTPGLSFITSAWNWLHPGGEQDRFVARAYGDKQAPIVVSAEARKMGITVTRQQAKWHGMPEVGAGYFDTLRSLPTPGAP